ncbi:MAG: phosphonate ABC transporter ATP-binding protein [Candidatus Sericytochromatia bacterium]|nr:phosphonate ABC transporter ATP-binding protein [Candidatus Tanganyikabacteria bacterium]
MQPIIKVENLGKTYANGPQVLMGVNLAFQPGEFTAILGLSGAGKSTFLRCLNRLVDPTEGRILVPRSLVAGGDEPGEFDVVKATPAELRRWRRKVGMIFQQFNLAKRLSVLDNVLSGSLGYAPTVPSTLRMFPESERARALENLDRVGLKPFAYQRADAISGGQQQRVAIARALMQRPAVILADEPVASLDPKLSMSILDLLRKICDEDGITVLVSLHVLELSKRYSSRLIGFAGGQVVFDGTAAELDDNVVKRVYQAQTEELKAYA